MDAHTESSTFKATPSKRLSGFTLKGLPSQLITFLSVIYQSRMKEEILHSLHLSIWLLLCLIILTFDHFWHLFHLFFFLHICS